MSEEGKPYVEYCSSCKDFRSCNKRVFEGKCLVTVNYHCSGCDQILHTESYDVENYWHMQIVKKQNNAENGRVTC